MKIKDIITHLQQHYLPEIANIQYIRSSINEVYRIDTMDKTYYLRIEPETHYFGKGRLKNEVELLVQLDTKMTDEFMVPLPITSHSGNYLEMLDGRQSALFTEVPGDKPSFPELHRSMVVSIITAMNTLHQNLTTISLQDQYPLIDQITASLDTYEMNLDKFSPIHDSFLQTGREIVDRVRSSKFPIQQLHGDLWSKNILVDQKLDLKVGFIDFDFTMIGPPIYDLAAFLATMKSDGIQLQPALEDLAIAHYISDGDYTKDDVMLMQQVRQLWIFGYWIEFSGQSLENIEVMVRNNFTSSLFEE